MKDGMLRLEIHPRHWLHIWKVGHVPCETCGGDGRFVASYLDESEEIVEQLMYCELHSPQPFSEKGRTRDRGDATSQLNLELGFSMTNSASTEIEIVDFEESAD